MIPTAVRTRRHRKSVTAGTQTSSGSTQDAKIPNENRCIRQNTTRSTSLATPKAKFSTGTTWAAFREMRAASWRLNTTQAATATGRTSGNQPSRRYVRADATRGATRT